MVKVVHPLDNPAYGSLVGVHARLAERRGKVLRYPADVASFLGLPDEPTSADWADAATLVGPGGRIWLTYVQALPPKGWEIQPGVEGIQMVADRLEATEDPEVVRLCADDVPEMLSLVGRTKPGPFRQRTIELGTYLGIRRGGRLVAMVGERMRPAGWTEISALCSAPEWRGHGLGSRLMRSMSATIMSRGETPFLQVVADNANAVRLHEELGFRARRRIVFSAAFVPERLAGQGH